MGTRNKKLKEETGVSAQYCTLQNVPERSLRHLADPRRQRLITQMNKMWANGTNLTYYFFKSPHKWGGHESQMEAVRIAFDTWKDLGIGLTFQEVNFAKDAALRIGFEHGAGSWSYIGRDSVDHRKNPKTRTCNFGWDLTTPYGANTALHEIGHALGFPHEHQNPKAGIVWNVEKVYESLGGPPNNWSRSTTYTNIIRKLPENDVDGSGWDKNSIMHYPFEAGLILEPAKYKTSSLRPVAGLSSVDIKTVKKIYPPLKEKTSILKPFKSKVIKIAVGEQIIFEVDISTSRVYTLETYGDMDTLLALFEVRDGTPVFIMGDDDSGQEYNAKIQRHLDKDKKYIVGLRLYFEKKAGEGAILLH